MYGNTPSTVHTVPRWQQLLHRLPLWRHWVARYQFMRQLYLLGEENHFDAQQIRKMYSLGKTLSNEEQYRFLQFAPPGHFYSPIPDYPTIKAEAQGNFPKLSPDLIGIEENYAGQMNLLQTFAQYYAEFPFTLEPQAPYRAYFDNNYFRHGDSLVLYSMMRHFRPRRIIEVGSGFSSAVMLDTRDFFIKTPLHLTFIEPYPERLYQLLQPQDREKCTIITKPVQQVDVQIFEELEANDILFIDSSHVVKVGSDVQYLFSNVIPRLRHGVILHLHDVCWPFEYPFAWFEEGRAWNEVYLVRAFLLFNHTFEILFWNGLMTQHATETLQNLWPIFLQDPGASLWLRKVA